MTKRYNPFNYGVTWLGIIRLAIAVYCCVWIIRLINMDESVFLKILLILICLVGIFGCLVEGLPNIRAGILKARDHSNDFIIGRDPPNLPKRKEQL